MKKKNESLNVSSQKNENLEDGIGSRIRVSREARGFTQAHLSEQTKLNDPVGQGISRTVIVGYEAEHSKPGAREIKLICNTLHITPNWLLYGEEDVFDVLGNAPEDLVRFGIDGTERTLYVAFALMALRQQERKSFSDLIFLIADRELGHEKMKLLQLEAKYMARVSMIEMLEKLQNPE